MIISFKIYLKGGRCLLQAQIYERHLLNNLVGNLLKSAIVFKIRNALISFIFIIKKKVWMTA